VGKILQAIHENPHVTRDELSRITGLTVRGIEWNLAELKKEGKIARVGPAKGGYWKTIDQNEEYHQP
jgi:ATP-dependent DNA helicase RecG